MMKYLDISSTDASHCSFGRNFNNNPYRFRKKSKNTSQDNPKRSCDGEQSQALSDIFTVDFA
jgi:hypothetical protein